MKTTTKSFSIYFTTLVISLGFCSCSDDGSVAIKPSPNESILENTADVLLTDNLVKEWRLVNIYDQNNVSIPVHKWTECNKSEILTFHSDKTFSTSCCDNCLSLYTWNVIEEKGKKFLNLESVENSAASAPWIGQEIIIHLLTAYDLIIEINGIKHEYVPYFLEIRNPIDYQ